MFSIGIRRRSPAVPFVFAFLLVSAGIALAQARRPVTIAHRGGMALRPENTMPAFQHALELGTDILEFDMTVTADDVVVIHHDLAINKTICSAGDGAGGIAFGSIRSLTLRQVQLLDCGSKRHPGYPAQVISPGARIPTLEELLRAFKDKKIEFLGETKMDSDQSPYFVDPARFVHLVSSAIRKHGVESRFILQSGDYRTLLEMQKSEPGIRTCMLNARKFRDDYVAAARRHGTTYLMINSDDLGEDDVPKLHAAGFQVFSSTANDPAGWTKYLRLGVDGILTDNPEGLIQFLNAEKSVLHQGPARGREGKN